MPSEFFFCARALNINYYYYTLQTCCRSCLKSILITYAGTIIMTHRHRSYSSGATAAAAAAEVRFLFIAASSSRQIIINAYIIVIIVRG